MVSYIGEFFNSIFGTNKSKKPTSKVAPEDVVLKKNTISKIFSKKEGE